MTFTLDPEMAAALAPMAEAMKDSLLPGVGDVATRRATFEPMMGQANGAPGTPADVTTTDHRATRADGTELLLRWYSKDGASPGSAVLYLHGGGMILGNLGIAAAALMDA